MTPAFEIAAGDQLPSFVLEVLNAANVVQPLGAATAVVAKALHVESGITLTLTATVSDATAGEVTIEWGTTDTLLPGIYRLWLVFTFPGGPMTVPTCPHGEDEFLFEVCPVP